MTEEKIIELMARAMASNDSGPEGSQLFAIHWEEFSEGYLGSARTALTALHCAGMAIVPVKPDDGRPEGWTEARALEFIARGGTDEQDFAELFVEGGWKEIDAHYPQFRAMIKTAEGKA